MNKRIFIEYKESNVLVNPYQVRLSSEDGTFGVRTSGGTVVVADDTVPTNSSTGVFEYTFDATANTIYVAVWEVYPTSSSQAVYVQQTLGPFTETGSSIKAIADTRGSFVQGTLANLFLIVTDLMGVPVQPETCTITISKNGTPIVDGISADFIKDGAYAYDWIIAEDADIGLYEVVWAYAVNGSTKYEYQEVIVSEQVADSAAAYYGNILAEYRNMFNLMAGCVQAIPVYFEEGIPNNDFRTFNFTFKRWNQSAGVRIYRNGKLLSEEDVEINYFKGKIIFAEPLHAADTINADYNFRWFSDEQINAFLFNAVSSINLYPPASSYNVYNVPGRFISLMMYGAVKDALREMMMCLLTQQPKEVFGGPEAAQQAFSNMETLKQNYETEFLKGLEQKKFGPYPKTRAIVTPEFTLPGGRSRWFRYLFNSGTG